MQVSDAKAKRHWKMANSEQADGICYNSNFSGMTIHFDKLRRIL